MKKKLFLLLLAFAALSASAKSVVFVLTDSTKVYYPLTEAVIKLSKNGFTVGKDSYQFERFDRFYITDEDAPTSVEALTDDSAAFNIMEADVYDLSGRKLSTSNSKLSTLPPGTYILRSGNRSVKIVKK